MGSLSIGHIILLLVVVLIFFGPSRLPGLGSSLGKAIRDFKDGLDGKLDDDEKRAQIAKNEANKELPSSSNQKSEVRSDTKKENS